MLDNFRGVLAVIDMGKNPNPANMNPAIEWPGAGRGVIGENDNKTFVIERY